MDTRSNQKNVVLLIFFTTMFNFVIHTRHSLARGKEYGYSVKKIESDILSSNQVYQLLSGKILIVWLYLDYVTDKCGRIITLLRKNRAVIDEKIEKEIPENVQKVITLYQLESYQAQKKKYDLLKNVKV